jgi:hypothetical protein
VTQQAIQWQTFHSRANLQKMLSNVFALPFSRQTWRMLMLGQELTGTTL